MGKTLEWLIFKRQARLESNFACYLFFSFFEAGSFSSKVATLTGVGLGLGFTSNLALCIGLTVVCDASNDRHLVTSTLRWKKGGVYTAWALFTLKPTETITDDICRKDGYSQNIFQCGEKNWIMHENDLWRLLMHCPTSGLKLILNIWKKIFKENFSYKKQFLCWIFAHVFWVSVLGCIQTFGTIVLFDRT